MRDIRIAVCERLEYRYARYSHSLMRGIRITVYEMSTPSFTGWQNSESWIMQVLLSGKTVRQAETQLCHSNIDSNRLQEYLGQWADILMCCQTDNRSYVRPKNQAVC